MRSKKEYLRLPHFIGGDNPSLDSEEHHGFPSHGFVQQNIRAFGKHDGFQGSGKKLQMKGKTMRFRLLLFFFVLISGYQCVCLGLLQ